MGMKVTIVVFLLVVLVSVIVALVVLLTPKPVEDERVEVVNFNTGTNVPVNYQSNVRRLIGNVMKASGALNAEMYVDATVREGTYREMSDDDGVRASFIIDVPSFKYSFAVMTNWSINEPDPTDKNVRVECPYYLDVIYTDTKCIAETPVEQVQRYLPHYEDLGGGTLSVEMRKYDAFQENANEPYLALSVRACGDTGILEAAQSRVVKWLKSRYLDPNDYHMEVLDICR